MSSIKSQCNKEYLRQLALQAGACAVGFACAEPVNADVISNYRKWIADGCHGEMGYLAKYDDVRFDPCQLLDGAKTVISMAFPYRPADGYHHPCIADYALGEDYHYVLRERLHTFVEYIMANFGANCRICVDTAPIPERYWAVKAGIGFVGKNHQLIVPGIGSEVFLCEVITTLEIPADEPCRLGCADCGACVKACPGGALSSNGVFDARRCLSYLSIEYRGELPDDVRFCGTIYGCDVCQHVCPHNNSSIAPLGEFVPDESIKSLTTETIRGISEADYRQIVAKSAMKRVKLPQLKRNFSKLKLRN